jgi:hypothetical protein
MIAKARLALSLARLARAYAPSCPAESVNLLRTAARLFRETGSPSEGDACLLTAKKLRAITHGPRSRPGVRAVAPGVPTS